MRPWIPWLSIHSLSSYLQVETIAVEPGLVTRICITTLFFFFHIKATEVTDLLSKLNLGCFPHRQRISSAVRAMGPVLVELGFYTGRVGILEQYIPSHPDIALRSW